MSIKSFLLKYKFLFTIVFVLLLGLRVLLLNFPLFKNLDLETAVSFSLIFALLSSFVGLFFLKRNEKISVVLLTYLILLLLLFLIFFVIEVLLMKCSITTGIFFFPIFTLTSTLFGLSLALLVNEVSGKKSWIILSSVILILIVYSLVEYFFEPQLFLFNPIIIFFPGLVYDEIFELDLKILLYTSIISISSSLIIFNFLFQELVNFKVCQKIHIHLKIIPFFLLTLIFLISDEVGLSTSQGKLRTYFPKQIEGRGFKIYIQNSNPQMYNGEVFISSVEYHYDKLKEMTSLSPNGIEIFIFRDDKEKKKLLGDETADFTKPWLRQIFVSEKSFHETIKHELAHIFLAEASDNIFKVAGKLNLGLIEGGAMALEWEWLEKTPMYYAALIDRFIGKFNAPDFFENYSFATRQTYLSYLMSGSFCKYLIDSYGIEKFMIFYRTGDFYFTYEKSLDNEFQNFLNSLREINLSENDSLKALVLFGGKSLFEKRCPRSLARINKKAIEKMNQKKFEEAEKLFLEIYEKRKDNDALSNLIRVKFFQKKYDEVVDICRQSEIKNNLRGLGSIRTLILYALSLRKINEGNEAFNIFNQLRKLDISSGWNSYIEMMFIFLNYPEFIDLISEKSTDWVQHIMQENFPEKWIFWKYSIDLISSEELDVVVENSAADFWVLEKSFYRYLQLGNFVKAKQVLDLIASNELFSDEVKKYQFDLMSYVLNNIVKTDITKDEYK